ncbi:hypothetical protein Fmac_011669 [Flemingia macrophylla]|uniref:TF-B3 domain-containing protein n=1 Tax=Flemingia macrophylla TaxID=520843 RepID=A0ABD1MN33_9FABA
MDHREQHKVGEGLIENEQTAIRLLGIMTQEKDPHKWHETLFGKSLIQEESLSSSSLSCIPTMEEDVETLVYLVTALREEKGKSLIEGSSPMVPSNILSQELPSNLPPLESLKGCVLECGKPLQKQLQSSDVKVDQNRIFLNKKHVEECFIPLLRNDENIQEGIQACVYDMHGNDYNMGFKKWAKKYNVLNHEWKIFIQNHELQKDDLVTVWIFRHSISNKINFVLEYEKIER